MRTLLCLFLSLLVPGPRDVHPRLIPGVLDVEWDGVIYVCHFDDGGIYRCRGVIGSWAVEETESVVTLTFSHDDRWYVMTFETNTGDGFGALVSWNWFGVPTYREEQKINVKLVPRRAPR